MIDNGIWESSKEFDRIITAIGKNRKYLLEIFKHMSQNGSIPMSEEVREIKKLGHQVRDGQNAAIARVGCSRRIVALLDYLVEKEWTH